ncbi:MAG: hypothetical protein RL417_2300, partial [Pseudomonadota bacterium]
MTDETAAPEGATSSNSEFVSALEKHFNFQTR